MFRHEFSCDACSTTAVYFHTIGLYRFDDGAEISRNDQPAWCAQCNTLRSAECLPDRAQLDQIINDLEQQQRADSAAVPGQRGTADPDTDPESLIRKWRSVLRQLDGRQSGPRCLTCESTELILLNEGNQESLETFIHVGCGGTFKVTNWWHSSEPSLLVLNSEGRRIASKRTGDATSDRSAE